MAFTTLPMAGVDVARRTAEPEHGLGTVVLADQNRAYIYVQASAVISDATVVVLTAAGFQVAGGAGSYTADIGFADNEYGWVRLTAPFLAEDA